MFSLFKCTLPGTQEHNYPTSSGFKAIGSYAAVLTQLCHEHVLQLSVHNCQQLTDGHSCMTEIF